MSCFDFLLMMKKVVNMKKEYNKTSLEIRSNELKEKLKNQQS